VFEYGLAGELISRLAKSDAAFQGGEILPTPPDTDQRLLFTADFCAQKGVDVALGIILIPAGDRQEITLTLVSPAGSQEIFRPYGGPPGNAPKFAVNTALDLLRKL
jgi:hypothetical protein